MPRITSPIDEHDLVTLTRDVHPLARAPFDRGSVPVSDPTGRMRLLLRRSAVQQQALTQYLSDLHNPRSPAYHKWITPAQYGARFGVDPADIQTIEDWLQSHGFHIEKVPASRNRIEFSGTIDQIQNAFHTPIHYFAVQGETRIANLSDIKIPAALAPLISGIGPLNNFRPMPGAVVGASGRWNATQHLIQPQLTLFGDNNSPMLFVDPADAATIYDSPNSSLNPKYTTGTSYTGKGATIGIAGVSNVDMQDIENYRTGFLGESTTSVNLPNVIIDGNDPGVDASGAGVEALLDTEVAGGLAPGAQVDFYISAGSDLSNGLFDAILRAVDDNAVDILSVSFGECESSLGSSGNQLLFEISEQAAAQGISVVVSAGDNGSGGCDNFDTAASAQGGLAVSGYASPPYSLAVGGTDFDVLAGSFTQYANDATSGAPPYYRTANEYIPEKPWNDSTTVNSALAQNSAYTNSSGATNIVAGSGGVSSLYAKPAYQSSLTPADGHRDLPDVSLLAGNGFYSALWTVCSDTLADGTSTTLPPSSDCGNTGGQFNNAATFTGVGGTSASAPAFAGILALVVQATGGRLGQADNVLYQLAQSHPSYFHDIASGNNSVLCVSSSPNCGSNGFLTGYNAAPGYDLATGLGSVDIASIVNNWSSVSLASTSTTLQINGSSSAYSGVHGANLTFGAGVTSSGGTPTGLVAITDNADITSGGTSSGPQNDGQFTIPLAAGSGSATWNGLPGGSYTVTARYGGSTSLASSTSTPISVSIAPEPSTTALAVDAYNLSGAAIPTNNIPYGSYVVADATITGTATGTSTQGLATGTMHFLNNGATLASVPVGSGNQASWPALSSSYQALPPGAYSLKAKYSGDASFGTSTSAASQFSILPGIATLLVYPGPAVLDAGDAEQIDMDLNATPTLGTPPSGNITISANGTSLQTISLGPPVFSNYESTSISASQLSAGSNNITVTYPGDANYASVSSTFNVFNAGNAGVTINPILNVSINPNSIVYAPFTFSPLGAMIGPLYPACAIAGTGNNVTCTVQPNYQGTAGPDSGLLIVTAAASATAGTYNATILLTDSETSKVYGTGTFIVTVGSSPTPSLAVFSNGNLNLAPGATSGNTSSVSIVASGGLTGQLNLTCAVTTSVANPVAPPTCSVPASVTLAPNALFVPVSVITSTTTSTGNYTFSVTATSAATPSVTGSSTANLSVTSSPAFAFSASGAVNLVAGSTTGTSTTVTVTPFNGYSGTLDLSCGELALPIISPETYPICKVPNTVNVSGPTQFNLTITATNNPSAPVSGEYLFTLTGNDTQSVILTSQMAVQAIVGTGGLALSNSGGITVAPGATTGNSSTITIAPANGFTGKVSLTCTVTTSLTNPNDPPTCAIAESVAISGTTAVTTALTVNTTAASTSASVQHRFAGGGAVALALGLLFGMRARRRWWSAFTAALAIAILASIAACGGGGGGGGGGGNVGTSAGTYTVNVTGTDAATGKITATTAVSLIVN